MSDERRFRELFADHLSAVRGYGHHRGVGGADLDDLVADVFTVAWRRLDQVPADDPRPWLLAVARNHWRNLTRAQRRRAGLAGRLARQPVPVALAPDEPAAADVDAATVLGALGRLGEGDREILRLVAWDELSSAQTAVVLGCTPGAARVRLHRARARLAAELGRTAAAAALETTPATTAPEEAP